MRSLKVWKDGKFERISFHVKGEENIEGDGWDASDHIVRFEDGKVVSLLDIEVGLTQDEEFPKHWESVFSWLDKFVWRCPQAHTDIPDLAIIRDLNSSEKTFNTWVRQPLTMNGHMFLWNGKTFDPAKAVLGDNGLQELERVVRLRGWEIDNFSGVT